MKMLKKEQNGIYWLEFELFQQFPHLKHAVFLRHGGKSLGPYSSLNLSQTMGDEATVVLQNIQMAKSCLQLKQLASGQQVHADGIAMIDANNWHLPLQADALMTNVYEVGLKITHADCQAAIFYDPTKQVVATVHCGWRGQVLDIYSKTIQTLRANYGCCAENIFVGIGPSLGPKHAEFRNYGTEFPRVFWPFECRPNYFDLWQIAEQQLAAAGILPQHMQLARLCTYASELDCFSYRRSRRVTGAHATMAVLRAF